ncbi:uncharacterized protein EV422DRAFT_162957 [Fimicolochytrium jonesii]|uniref:uncharacterized protein n=1 Tax=Fimicolochytrium jonesii TaxID=1396493 RepID=UPI0022FE4F96|nr:uncharacterized protein EV422DRAFT_162957 [Fimicolochytrium jonesii]KAI8818727.1 hypothetical protein EV422DRAFT_162957 [Fimicolochytrium jonesii]
MPKSAVSSRAPQQESAHHTARVQHSEHDAPRRRSWEDKPGGVLPTPTSTTRPQIFGDAKTGRRESASRPLSARLGHIENASNGQPGQITQSRSAASFGSADPSYPLKQRRHLSADTSTLLSPTSPPPGGAEDADGKEVGLRAEMLALYKQIKSLKAANPPDRDEEFLRALVARYKKIKAQVRPAEALPTPLSSTTSPALPLPPTHLALERLHLLRQHHRRPSDISQMTFQQCQSEKSELKNELVLLKAIYKKTPSSTEEEKKVARGLWKRYVEVRKRCEEAEGESGGMDREVLEALELEKKGIQLRLRRFQDDFKRTNGRAVRTAQDRQPIAQSYRRYQELKTQIAAMKAC